MLWKKPDLLGKDLTNVGITQKKCLFVGLMIKWDSMIGFLLIF